MTKKKGSETLETEARMVIESSKLRSFLDAIQAIIRNFNMNRKESKVLRAGFSL